MGPSINHSYLCKKIIIAIEKTEKWEAWPDLSLDIESGIIADIAVYEKGKISPDFSEDKVKCDVLPQLVIEVASPSQSIHSMMLKASKFIKAGLPIVWTVEPYGKIVYVSTEQGRKVELAGMVVNEGIQIDFSKIFDIDEQGT